MNLFMGMIILIKKMIGFKIQIRNNKIYINLIIFKFQHKTMDFVDEFSGP